MTRLRKIVTEVTARQRQSLASQTLSSYILVYFLSEFCMSIMLHANGYMGKEDLYFKIDVIIY